MALILPMRRTVILLVIALLVALSLAFLSASHARAAEPAHHTISVGSPTPDPWGGGGVGG